MKNYAEMTDFEINCLVAEATGHRPPHLTIWLERLTSWRLHKSDCDWAKRSGFFRLVQQSGRCLGHHFQKQNRHHSSQTGWRVESGPQAGG